MSTTAGPSIHLATPERWDDLAALFGRPGPRGGRQDTANCWCIVWRGQFGSPDDNRTALCRLVRDGHEPGLLAYLDDEPMGWISVAPLAQFPTLLRSTRFRPHPEDLDGDDPAPDVAQDDPPRTFLVSCFHVDRRARGQGLARRLLEAAVEHATDRGAATMLAYPSEPPDYKGDPSWFLDAGFTPVRRIGKRSLMRRSLAR